MADDKRDVSVRKGALEKAPAPAQVVGPLDEMERWFDDLFSRRWLRPWRWESRMPEGWSLSMPKVDVVDRANEVVVRAEVPGVEKKDIEVSVSGNMLTIRGETRKETKDDSGDFYRAEITRGSFSRTLALPAEVDDSKTKASMKDGMLELTLPKVEKAKRRSIKID
ncbi:MAG: Hsp20/alpha crystallin family protein [Burkholderiales bacterium]|nr:Hsp20/alpha crystallin family protein [Burkholderiales bacterium]